METSIESSKRMADSGVATSSMNSLKRKADGTSGNGEDPIVDGSVKTDDGSESRSGKRAKLSVSHEEERRLFAEAEATLTAIPNETSATPGNYLDIDDATQKKDPPADTVQEIKGKLQNHIGSGSLNHSELTKNQKMERHSQSIRTMRDPEGFVAGENDTIRPTPNNRAGDDHRYHRQGGGSMVMSLEIADTYKLPTYPPAPILGDPPVNRKSSSRGSNGLSNHGYDVGISSTRSLRRSSRQGEIVSTVMELPSLSKNAKLDPLSSTELKDLEAALELSKDDDWRDDWSGNLALADKEIKNPKKSRGGGAAAGSFRQTLFSWASQDDNVLALKYLYNLFRYVYHMKGTPAMAKKILANANRKDGESMEKAVRRASCDPVVLQQDGWTTEKGLGPPGATGGAHRIGEKVRWHGADGIVIAYIHDHDLGDLWRGIWLEEGMESFDMEAEELIDARKRWERRAKASFSTSQGAQNQKKKDNGQRRSNRYSSASDLKINGIEYGIVLASSFRKGARPGVLWPARVMHASEASSASSVKGKRNAPRQRLELVFLAPYWNSHGNISTASSGASNRRAPESFSESLSRHGESLFSSGPLFDVESVDVAEDTIKEYPYDGRVGGVDIDQLRVAFRFSGLPKAAFARFLDSHRLAMALKSFAQENLNTRGSDQATAGLFDRHPMSVMAPLFPPEILHLPYAYILSQLPAPSVDPGVKVHDGESNNNEPILRLRGMIEAMKPPSCWGESVAAGQNGIQSPLKRPSVRVADSPFIDAGALLRKSRQAGEKPVQLEDFTNDLLNLNQAVDCGTIQGFESILHSMQHLLSSVIPEFASLGNSEKQMKAQSLARSWVLAKGNGEDAIGASNNSNNTLLLLEWRRGCERIYKFITHALSAEGYGNGVSVVLTDFRCNKHVTSCGCFERPVRLPAALKAARDVGAGKNTKIQLVSNIEESFLDAIENRVLMKAHTMAYLRRMKARCSQIQGDNIVYLTEDSDGNGGEDTKGSKGTWTAAVASVAAAIKAVDMVVAGQCVNAFCATRPPGHHAGKNLHPMKAVSNGFCILNTAACAALHATTPLSEGGPGLRRVCVIDFDVHHGNGTQDILCSTYDPRFLYVSLHAGGAFVNGLPESDDFGSELHAPGGSSKKGIYPGRCGDTSPHRGVLNIPLGPRVTSHAVGTALINQVSPAVDAFSPDLIILSAGFDAHKHDPLGLGGLSAEDFGHITDVACNLASKSCSGRLISLLEGGYGVPCCSPQRNLFLPSSGRVNVQGQGLPNDEQSDHPGIVQERNAEKARLESKDQEHGQDFEERHVAARKRPKETAERPLHADIAQEQSKNESKEKETEANEKVHLDEPAEQPQQKPKILELEIKGENHSMQNVPGDVENALKNNDIRSCKDTDMEIEKHKGNDDGESGSAIKPQTTHRPQPSKLLDLGDDLPSDMDDQVPYALQRRLEKCHAEGFIDCVRSHVKSLMKCNTRS